jgi:hypothetical protein
MVAITAGAKIDSKMSIDNICGAACHEPDLGDEIVKSSSRISPGFCAIILIDS